MDLRPGEHFDRYVLERLLAETRMSRVWLAQDTAENRAVALKTIRRFEENEDLVEAAQFGAALQQMLSGCDQRVVNVHRYGSVDSHFFIDMEYVDGKDVSQILAEQGRIAPDKAVRIALAVAETLDNLHSFSDTIDGRPVVSAVHGDLKPKNIRITGDLAGEFAVKVLDFGTAKALSLSKPGGTRTAAWSPAYASPELLERREMNPLSDRWALGVTLYEMVAGRVPFGAGKSVEEMEAQIRNRGRMPDLGVPDCPAALHAIVGKLLDPEPARRYQSARELCLDLRNYPNMPAVAGYQGETVRSADPPSSTAATRRSTAVPRPAPPRAPARLPAPPRSPRWLLTRAALSLAAIALVLWLTARESGAVREARQLESDLAAEKIAVTAAREKFVELSGRPFVLFPRQGIEKLLNAGLVAQGDAIVTRFRTSGVKQADWKQARVFFAQASEISPRDDAIRGRLRLCDGHLKRFQAQTEKDPAALGASEERFREAAGLLRDSPDPWLGLAMLLLYNQKEPEKGEQALQQARSRGYDFASENRWVSLLADCYRLRADQLEWEALRIARTLPGQAIERLDRAAGYDQKAIDWYSKIPLFRNALRDIERCRAALERIQARRERVQPQEAGNR